MSQFTLSEDAKLTGIARELVEAFDSANSDNNGKFTIWESNRVGDPSIPESWKHSLNIKDDKIALFCIETTLSLCFRSVIASRVSETPPENFEELILWQEKTAESHFPDIVRSPYFWVSDIEYSNYDLDEVITIFDDFEFSEQHDVFGSIYHDLFNSELRKELGEFYTDQTIIQYLLRKTNYAETPWSKKLIDPACGSGSFLLSAIQKLSESNTSELGGQDIYQICNRPLIVGFDINPFACELARLRLFNIFYPPVISSDIRIEKLPIFNINTLDRRGNNNSIENQSLDQFTDSEKDIEKTVDNVQIQELASYSYDQETSSVINKLYSNYKTEFNNNEYQSWYEKELIIGKILQNNVDYDVVVGNPPYVRIQNIPKHTRDKYKTKFHSATGRFDLSVLFLEYGVDVLAENGRLGFITTNKFLSTQYGRGIREYLTKNTSLNTLIDFTDTDVFDVTVLPCVLVVEKSVTKEELEYGILMKTADSPENKVDDVFDIFDTQYSNTLSEGKYDIKLNGGKESVKARSFTASQPDGSEEPWRFLPHTERHLIDKILDKRDFNLEQIAEKISVGIKTTANDVFVDPIKESSIEKLNLEEELIYPAISGKNVSRWDIEWDSEDPKNPSYILYPHKQANGSVEPVNLEKYPYAKEYLEDNYDQLASRTYLEDAGREWYECWVPQHPDIFDVDNKIVTPEISVRNNFALDTSGYFCIGSCFSILLEGESKELYELILGQLNSELAEFFLKVNSSTQLYSNRFRYNKSYIKNLPIILPEGTDPEDWDNLSKSSTPVGERLMDIPELIQQIRNTDNSVIALEEEINEIVYEAYDITQNERKVVEQALEFASDR